MITNTQYGLRETPVIVDIDSTNRVKCHYCNPNPIHYGEDKNIKYFKRGDKALEIVYNSGPTGTAYVCLEHSKQLMKEMIGLIHGKN